MIVLNDLYTIQYKTISKKLRIIVQSIWMRKSNKCDTKFSLTLHFSIIVLKSNNILEKTKLKKPKQQHILR